MNLKDLDLNLLVVFDQLLVERRVSKVADNLGLSQPAVSNALARLRKVTDDPLFLRNDPGHGTYAVCATTGRAHCDGAGNDPQRGQPEDSFDA